MQTCSHNQAVNHRSAHKKSCMHRMAPISPLSAREETQHESQFLLPPAESSHIAHFPQRLRQGQSRALEVVHDGSPPYALFSSRGVGHSVCHLCFWRFSISAASSPCCFNLGQEHRLPCCDVTRFGRDDGCAGCCHHLFHRMTIVCRQRSIRRKICPHDQCLRQVSDQMRHEPTTAVHTAPTTGSDPQVSAKPETPVPISFVAFSEDPIPLK